MEKKNDILKVTTDKRVDDIVNKALELDLR